MRLVGFCKSNTIDSLAIVIGVQWHPERMCAGQKREDTIDGIGIFKYFIDMCK